MSLYPFGVVIQMLAALPSDTTPTTTENQDETWRKAYQRLIEQTAFENFHTNTSTILRIVQVTILLVATATLMLYTHGTCP